MGTNLLLRLCDSFIILLFLQNLSFAFKTEGEPPQYYYRGGFRPRKCIPKSPLQLQSFSLTPKISVRYDGRYFNSSFATLKKLSVRENMLHISCNAKYPVTLLPNPWIMEEKSLAKSFEDNMDTECNTESTPPKSPCSNYTVSTSIPVHLLASGLTIDTQCQSFCKQVSGVTTLQVFESKGIIYGNMSSRHILSDFPPTTTTPSVNLGGYIPKEDNLEDDSSDLVQIFVSPVGGLRKSWNIKCSTNSDLTAKGARLLMKLDNSEEPYLIKERKEYRKAGIHTIRATFDLPSEDVDYVHCLFPRLNDFPWISRHTSIHFHDPISYWECILRLCGAFLCSFILIGGICFVIHKWLHSDCCRGSGRHQNDVSSSQLSLRHSQRSLSISHHIQAGPVFPRKDIYWNEEEEDDDDGNSEVEEECPESAEQDEYYEDNEIIDYEIEGDKPVPLVFMKRNNKIKESFNTRQNTREGSGGVGEIEGSNDPVAQLHDGSISTCHL